MAELIKTAVLEGGDFPDILESLTGGYPPGSFSARFPAEFIHDLLENQAEKITRCVFRTAALKGRIVAADPRETGGERRLLNLGHTFAHALEASAGLGNISHGEAVAWGIARSCELGVRLGVTPLERAMEIAKLLKDAGYETKAPYPLNVPAEKIFAAMTGDKKKKHGKLAFIVPVSKGAALVSEGIDGSQSVRLFTPDFVEKTINGEYRL
jgi:3-dehydroquinate synthase